eukprot:gene8970-biopygen4232
MAGRTVLCAERVGHLGPSRGYCRPDHEQSGGHYRILCSANEEWDTEVRGGGQFGMRLRPRGGVLLFFWVQEEEDMSNLEPEVRGGGWLVRDREVERGRRPAVSALRNFLSWCILPLG